MDIEHFEIEGRGAKEGINPFMGSWQKRFDFRPIPYSARRELKDQFVEQIRNYLDNKFYFSSQVAISITLYLHHQRAFETLTGADVDNYSKTILDALKGSRGVIIDDIQVHSFCISWIDVPGDEYFEVNIRSSPDEFVVKNVTLYELSNNFYYPVSD